MLYCHGLFPDLFQSTKKVLLRCLLYLHAKLHPIPFSGLPCKHDTDRPLTFFTQKINHNPINLHQIPTKIGTEMCFNEPFMCTKFQLDGSMRSQVMAKNAKCAKRQRRIRRKKTKKLFWNFARLYLGIGWCNFISNLACTFALFGGISAANLVEFRWEISKLHRCENYVLSIYSRGGMTAS